MIVISYLDYLKYGCPSCEYDSAAGGNFSDYGASDGTCRECGTNFVILSDGQRKSGIGYGTGKKILTEKQSLNILNYNSIQEKVYLGTNECNLIQDLSMVSIGILEESVMI